MPVFIVPVFMMRGCMVHISDASVDTTYQMLSWFLMTTFAEQIFSPLTSGTILESEMKRFKVLEAYS